MSFFFYQTDRNKNEASQTLLDDFDKTLSRPSQVLKTERKMAVENSVDKGENAVNQHFLLFPLCFHPFTEKFLQATCIEYYSFEFGGVQTLVVR